MKGTYLCESCPESKYIQAPGTVRASQLLGFWSGQVSMQVGYLKLYTEQASMQVSMQVSVRKMGKRQVYAGILLE